MVLKSAGFWHRIASMLYEGLVIIALFMVATFLYLLAIHNFSSAGNMGSDRHLLQVWLALVAGLYFTWFWVHGGQTIAMKTWRLKITDRQGRKLTASRAILRYLVALAGFFFFGAGLLWALFDREKLFLHDRLLSTLVISCWGSILSTRTRR